MKTASLILAFALLSACSPDPATDSRGANTVETPEAATGEASHYSGRVDFDTANGSLSADLTVHLAVDANQEALAFLLNGGLELSQLSGDAVLGFDAAPMAEGADWDQVTVRVEPAPSRRWLDLRFIYSGSPTLPESRINRIEADWVELSVDAAWHPVVATIDREFTTGIELGLPPGWTLISSGEAQPIADGYRLDTEIPHPDIAFVAAPDLDSLEGDGFTVYYRGAPADTAAAVLGAATACRGELDRRFGVEKRLPSGRFVITDRQEGGYARKNFIALTAVAGRDEADLTTFLCHELAHYWSSGAKPLTVDNWLNEGFAVLVAAQSARRLLGEETWESAVAGWRERAAGQPSIWTPDDLARRPFEVNYKKAPLALMRLEQEIGDAAFDRLLERYMTDPINDTPTLLATLEEEAGAPARQWFEAVLAEDDSAADPSR